MLKALIYTKLIWAPTPMLFWYLLSVDGVAQGKVHNNISFLVVLSIKLEASYKP